MKPPVTTLHTTSVAAVADSNTLRVAAGRQVSRAGGRDGQQARQGPANTLCGAGRQVSRAGPGRAGQQAGAS